MPELPEVETVRRQLQPLIAGRKILSFKVLPGAERLLRGRSDFGDRLATPGLQLHNRRQTR